jgi:hypothetical protein
MQLQGVETENEVDCTPFAVFVSIPSKKEV